MNLLGRSLVIGFVVLASQASLADVVGDFQVTGRYVSSGSVDNAYIILSAARIGTDFDKSGMSIAILDSGFAWDGLPPDWTASRPITATADNFFASINASAFNASIEYIGPVGEAPQTLSVSITSLDSSVSSGSFTVNNWVALNQTPVVSIDDGDQAFSDSDETTGEHVSLSGNASDSDGAISLLEWVVDSVVVATGTTASIYLPDGTTTVTLRATDDDGDTSEDLITVTVEAYVAPEPEPDLSPQRFNTVAPDSSLGIEVNNIAEYRIEDETLLTCIAAYTGGVPVTLEAGISQFAVTLKLLSLNPVLFRLEEATEFNPDGLLTDSGDEPDCSGRFETTTGLYSDVVQIGEDVGRVLFRFSNVDTLELELLSYEALN